MIEKTDPDNLNKKSPGISICTIAYLLVWVVIFLFLMWRAAFGAASYDESLYLSIPYRLYQGDAMIWDEWNLAQLSTLATIPFIFMYTHVFNGTEGITLAYRYLSVIVWSLVSLAIYLRLWVHIRRRGYGEWGAALSSVVFMLYAPFGLMVLSYNTFALIALVLSALVLLSYYEDNGERNGHFRWMLAGFLYAYSVLCCPHILIIWVLGFIYAVCKKRVRRFVYFTIGAACLAVILGIYIFGRASIGQIMTAIPVMLTDPYHRQVSLWGYVKDYVVQVLYGIPNGIWIYICCGILTAVVLADKGRAKRKRFYFVAGCLLTLALLVLAWFFRRYINCFIFPVNLLALLVAVIDRDTRTKPVFMCFWVPGILYSFCINMSSNQYWLAISSASCLALVGSIAVIYMFLEDMKVETDVSETGKFRLSAILFLAVILAVILPVAYLRYSFVFINSDITAQTGLIEKGPQKGVWSSPEEKETYDGILADLEEIKAYKPEGALFFARDNWPYMAGGLKCASYSPWLQNEIDDFAVVTLLKYYAMDGSRKPDIIYIDKDYKEYADRLLKELDYEVTETTTAGNMIACPK